MSRDAVIVYVMRPGAGGEGEVLASHDGVPESAIATGEHPAEAALRTLSSTIGRDDFFAFRKVTVTRGRHYFMTSADERWPAAFDAHGRVFHWVPLADALTQLPEAQRDGLKKLADER